MKADCQRSAAIVAMVMLMGATSGCSDSSSLSGGGRPIIEKPWTKSDFETLMPGMSLAALEDVMGTGKPVSQEELARHVRLPDPCELHLQWKSPTHIVVCGFTDGAMQFGSIQALSERE